MASGIVRSQGKEVFARDFLKGRVDFSSVERREYLIQRNFNVRNRTFRQLRTIRTRRFTMDDKKFLALHFVSGYKTSEEPMVKKLVIK